MRPPKFTHMPSIHATLSDPGDAPNTYPTLQRGCLDYLCLFTVIRMLTSSATRLSSITISIFRDSITSAKPPAACICRCLRLTCFVRFRYYNFRSSTGPRLTSGYAGQCIFPRGFSPRHICASWRSIADA